MTAIASMMSVAHILLLMRIHDERRISGGGRRQNAAMIVMRVMVMMMSLIRVQIPVVEVTYRVSRCIDAIWERVRGRC